MISLNWIGSISFPLRRNAAIVRIADAVLDLIQRDRERAQLAMLDERAITDFCPDRGRASGEAAKPFWRD